MEVTATGLRDANEIERSIAKFATVPNGGLILTASVVGGPSPFGGRSCGAVQPANDLLPPFLRQQRRLNFIWI
jgi:hypothetical protein